MSLVLGSGEHLEMVKTMFEKISSHLPPGVLVKSLYDRVDVSLKGYTNLLRDFRYKNAPENSLDLTSRIKVFLEEGKLLVAGSGPIRQLDRSALKPRYDREARMFAVSVEGVDFDGSPIIKHIPSSEMDIMTRCFPSGGPRASLMRN